MTLIFIFMVRDLYPFDAFRDLIWFSRIFCLAASISPVDLLKNIIMGSRVVEFNDCAHLFALEDSITDGEIFSLIDWISCMIY